MGIKHYQEKNARAMEKELAQSDIPVKRKIQKTIRNTIFQESGIVHCTITFHHRVVEAGSSFLKTKKLVHLTFQSGLHLTKTV